MSALSLDKSSVSVQGKEIFKSVSFDVVFGKMVGLLGPNGAGKTTAVRALLGLQPLNSGRALINGQLVSTMKPRDRALAVSYLPQARKFAWPISVREAVALGRFAYGGAMGILGASDASAVDHAMAQCDLTSFANRSVATLSGGELARVHIARALASGASAIIADEPVSALDPRHALDVLTLLQDQARAGAAVLVILHDLSLAARFCDDIVLLHEGHLVVQAPPKDALTPAHLEHVYGVSAKWQDGELRLVM